jgi:hypothetical protein
LCFAANINSDVIAPFNEGNTRSPIQSVDEAKDVLVKIVEWIYTIFYILAVLFLLMAAYNFLIGGGGKEDKVRAAKEKIKYAIIAIVIALIASGVAVMIKNFLGPEGKGGRQPVRSTESSDVVEL